MIYFIVCEPSDLIKVGLARDLKSRLSELQTGCPFPLEVIATYEGDRRVEMQMHRILANEKCRGEWFDGELVRGFLAQADEIGFVAALEDALARRAEASEVRRGRRILASQKFAAFLTKHGLDGGKRRLTAVDFLNHSREMGPEFTNEWLAFFGIDHTEAPMCREAADQLIRVVTPLSSAAA